jgi:hypothetical protein
MIGDVALAGAAIAKRFAQRGTMDPERGLFDDRTRPSSRDQLFFGDRLAGALATKISNARLPSRNGLPSSWMRRRAGTNPNDPKAKTSSSIGEASSEGTAIGSDGGGYPQAHPRYLSVGWTKSPTPSTRRDGAAHGRELFERPILNSPCAYPGRHWELDAERQPTNRIIEARPRCELITPVPKPQRRRRIAEQGELRLRDGDGLSGADQQYDPPCTSTRSGGMSRRGATYRTRASGR